MAKKIFYVTRTENPATQTAGEATLNRADQPQLVKVYDTTADVETDIANIGTNEIVATKEVDMSSYAIVDRIAEGNLNPVTSNAVAEAIEPLKVYSTTETIVGTWIDGKPIYRKAGFKSGNVDNVIIDSTLTMSYIQNIVDAGGSVTVFDAMVPVGGYADSNARSSLISKSNGLMYGTSDGTPHDLYWWIEYTKTTD